MKYSAPRASTEYCFCVQYIPIVVVNLVHCALWFCSSLLLLLSETAAVDKEEVMDFLFTRNPWKERRKLATRKQIRGTGNENLREERKLSKKRMIKNCPKLSLTDFLYLMFWLLCRLQRTCAPATVDRVMKFRTQTERVSLSLWVLKKEERERKRAPCARNSITRSTVLSTSKISI